MGVELLDLLIVGECLDKGVPKCFFVVGEVLAADLAAELLKLFAHEVEFIILVPKTLKGACSNK